MCAKVTQQPPKQRQGNERHDRLSVTNDFAIHQQLKICPLALFNNKRFLQGFITFLSLLATNNKNRTCEKKMGSLKNETGNEVNQREQEDQEPILMEQNQRFCMFPIRYKQLWEMYKKAEASFWTGSFSFSLSLTVC